MTHSELEALQGQEGEERKEARVSEKIHQGPGRTAWACKIQGPADINLQLFWSVITSEKGGTLPFGSVPYKVHVYGRV